MADHPVPQDVEADDKLIGPFGFRQFVYLMIVGGLIVLAIALWQIFPLLSIIPVPFAIFLLTLPLLNKLLPRFVPLATPIPLSPNRPKTKKKNPLVVSVRKKPVTAYHSWLT